MSWSRFFAQALKDLRLFLYSLVCLSLFRVVLIMTFIDRKDPASGLADILSVMANGLRFDSRISACVILPTLVLSIVGGFFPIDKFLNKVRYAVAMTFTILSLLVFGATIPFFKEYNDHFNQWLFGLFFDDVAAIAKTVWTQVPVITILMVVVALTVVAAFFLKRVLNHKSQIAMSARQWPVGGKIIVTICMLGLLVAATRGSVGPRPVQLKDAAVTRDEFLNKTVLTPYDALRYLLENYQHFHSAQGIEIYLPHGDIRSGVKSFFNDSRDFNDIDQYMRRICKGANDNPPKHIFLIVMEGYDTWPMLDEYQSMQLSPHLKSIAAQGIWIKRFLPAGNGTPQSLAAIITGLPDAKVMTNYQPSALKTYPSSIAPIFKKLGYKTRFFYGGYLSWQRIGEFARAQGFEEIYGAPHMGKWVHANEWGVDDKALFDFIEKTIPGNQPSFSMVMTTTYHPPYDTDVFGLGFPNTSIPADLASLYDGGIEMKTFGHLWYADKVLGEFVRRMEQRLDKPLFAVTADHWSRKFLNSKPTLFEKSSVPLVLYGPAVLSGKHAADDVVGCQTDIGPTLIELAAPKGFVYHSIGRDLLSDPASPAAFGAANIIIGPAFIMDMYNPKMVEALPGYPFIPPDSGQIVRMANQYFAIGWWRIMRGPALP